MNDSPTSASAAATLPPHRRRRTPLALRAWRAAFSVIGAVFPGAAGRIAHFLWYRASRRPVTARELLVLHRARCNPIAHAGLPVWVYVWGTGPTILLVHGWSGRAAQLTRWVAPLVKAGHQVVAFDAPAHGRSAGKATTAFDISAVIAELATAWGPLHAIVAHSFGVLCALHAMQRGVAVKRFVGISPPATLDGLLNKFSTTLALPANAVRALRRRLEVRFGDNIWSQFSAVNIAATMTAPALIVHDREDREIAWQEGAAIATAWPGAELQLTQGLGHARLLRDCRVVTMTTDFICTPIPNAD